MELQVNQLCDLLDEIAMFYYEHEVSLNPHYSYLEGLTKAIASVVQGKLLVQGLTKEASSQIKEKIASFNQIEATKESIRKALFLLEIKAYKHAHWSLDQMLPDGVAIIFTFLLESMQLKSSATILDVTLKNANLSMVLAEYLKGNYHLIGLEKNHQLCLYDEQKANLLETDLSIRFQDSLKFSYPNVDAIVADLTNVEYHNDYYSSPMYEDGVRDFCYLAIEKHLASGDRNCLACYLVDADFFSLKNKDIFKKHFDKDGFFKMIITLPPNFFIGSPKMIVVVAKKNSKYQQRTSIFTMPNYEDQNNWQKTLINIKNEMGE